ncbi:uncharacterized protein LOC127751111 isoform X2 [Frankliniella occidentalis]|uniref:Uncharacterized protein LOC127751111 isoform X2 n=1 Tax=Frankliniella occidentalis TaxID=133901 RepID=A0A9C6XT73_FRAOC|nr:uncharacterized protein LOC127751111 isoform X2 [Frankliniella occidentalis]
MKIGHIPIIPTHIIDDDRVLTRILEWTSPLFDINRTRPRNVLDMSKRSLWSHFTQKNRKIGLEVFLSWTSAVQPMESSDLS